MAIHKRHLSQIDMVKLWHNKWHNQVKKQRPIIMCLSIPIILMDFLKLDIGGIPFVLWIFTKVFVFVLCDTVHICQMLVNNQL